MLHNFTDPKAQLNNQLVLAARAGNLPDLEDALEQQADVNHVVHPFGSALYAAAKNGHLSAVQQLIKYKADVNLACNITPIMTAIENNHIQIVTLLLKNGAILGLDESLVALNVTKLMARCLSFDDLLAFMETLTNCGLTDRAIIKLLPHNFEDFRNEKIKEDIYAYLTHHISPEDRIQVCQDALNAEHPIGYIIDLMRRPHEWGENTGIKKDIEVLRKNAEKDLAKMPTNDLEMPDIAKEPMLIEDDEEDGFVVMNVVYDRGILFSLNDPSADRNCKEKDIFDAIALEDLNLINKLIAQDAKVLNRWVNRRGYCPLEAAIIKGKLTVVEHFLKCNAHTNFKSKYDLTLLQTAIHAGKLEIVKLLVNWQVNPYQTNKRGFNAFYSAARSRLPEIANFFLEYLDTHRDSISHNYIRRYMLAQILKSIKDEKDGKKIIETLEMLDQNHFENSEICHSLRMSFSGKCKDDIKQNILTAIKASKALPDPRIYKQRIANVQNDEHPLGCIMTLIGTVAEFLTGDTMFWSYVASKTGSGKMLEQMLKEDELEDFVLLCEDPEEQNSASLRKSQ